MVKSLARPDRNLTGIMGTGPEFEGKRLEVLREALPSTRRVAVLASTFSWNGAAGEALRGAAARLGMTLLYAESGPNDYTRAFAAFTRARPDAIFIGGGPYLFADRYRLIEFAIRNRLPLMGQGQDFTEAGALISYGGSAAHFWERTANHVDRLLKGAKPADLPIEQTTTFRLIVNMKTARTLGLTISKSVLSRADQLIQ